MSDKPKRIKRQRTRGWKMPENAVYVGRPTKWGNPFYVDQDMDAAEAVVAFEDLVAPALPVHELRGKDLVCWCRYSEPCHADVLLKLANDTDYLEDINEQRN